jgi:hypothetical protein
MSVARRNVGNVDKKSVWEEHKETNVIMPAWNVEEEIAKAKTASIQAGLVNIIILQRVYNAVP